MKKDYTNPVIEKIEFDYSIVTAQSGCTTSGTTRYNDTASANCELINIWTTPNA